MRFLLTFVIALGVHGLALAQGTEFAKSPDGSRIAYDVAGTGPVVILLHGGGQTRRIWHETGYVTRLQKEFKVVAVDMRGNGDSDKPDDPSAYALDRLVADVLAVADSVGAKRFSLWGFSYGANIGRYVASRSDRVQSMVYIGIPFGPATDGIFRSSILDLQAKWLPIIAAARAGKFDPSTLVDRERAQWQRGMVAVELAWLSAMLDYPPVEPKDMRCPTLWVVGTSNPAALQSVQEYRPKLEGTNVTVELLPGLLHPQELMSIDAVFPLELEFTRRHTR
jgi:pimeloyl-ACP methyl ester carboxylesterase